MFEKFSQSQNFWLTPRYPKHLGVVLKVQYSVKSKKKSKLPWDISNGTRRNCLGENQSKKACETVPLRGSKISIFEYYFLSKSTQLSALFLRLKISSIFISNWQRYSNLTVIKTEESMQKVFKKYFNIYAIRC